MRDFANLSATLHSPRHWTSEARRNRRSNITALLPTDCPSGCDQTYRSGPANALLLAPLIGSFLLPPPKQAPFGIAHLAGAERESPECRKMDTGCCRASQPPQTSLPLRLHLQSWRISRRMAARPITLGSAGSRLSAADPIRRVT